MCHCFYPAVPFEFVSSFPGSLLRWAHITCSATVRDNLRGSALTAYWVLRADSKPVSCRNVVRVLCSQRHRTMHNSHSIDYNTTKQRIHRDWIEGDRRASEERVRWQAKTRERKTGGLELETVLPSHLCHWEDSKLDLQLDNSTCLSSSAFFHLQKPQPGHTMWGRRVLSCCIT